MKGPGGIQWPPGPFVVVSLWHKERHGGGVAENLAMARAAKGDQLMNICHITVSGRVTEDAKVRETKGGDRFVCFSIARNRRGRDGAETTEYYSCTWFGSYAEKVAKALRKGVKVCVEGSFSTRLYEREETDAPGISLDIKVGSPDVLSPRQAKTPSGETLAR